MRVLAYQVTIHALWLAANIVCATALFIGVRRKCLARLPTFFTYLGFLAVQTLIGLGLVPLAFAFPQIEPLYHWIQVALALASFALETAVIYELWNKVVLSRSSVANSFRPLPRWGGAALLLAATVIAAMLPQNVSSHALQVYSTLSLCLSVLDIGLLLILVPAARLIGVPWGVLPAGVALGVVIADAGDAVRSILLNQMGAYYFMDVIMEGSSLLAAIVWLTSVVQSANSTVSPTACLQGTGDQIALSEQFSKVLIDRH